MQHCFNLFTESFGMKGILLWLSLSFSIQLLQAQYEYTNTKIPYHPQQAAGTKPPQGYKPVFINYVGRHGARFLTSPGEGVLVINILQHAATMHALTATGVAILQQLVQFENIEKSNYGNITLLGMQEQRD